MIFIFIEVGVFHNLKIPGLQRSLVRITCLFHIKSLGRSPCWTCVASWAVVVDKNGCPRTNVFNCVPTNNVYVCLIIILFFNMLNFLVRQKRGDFLCWKKKIMLVKLEHEKKSLRPYSFFGPI